MSTEELRVEVRHLNIDDYDDLKDSMIEAYSGWESSYWKESHIKRLLEIFPEGQVGVMVNGKIVAIALALIVDYAKYGDEHSYRQITGNFTFSTHDPDGDVLYGIELFVHPDYRNLRLGRRLYEARKEICEKFNLRSVIIGGRIPNYNKYADELTPRQYIDKVNHKEIYDPVFSFQLANDFRPIKILKNYLEGDTESLEYAVLLEWSNIYFEEKETYFSQTKSVVRLGLVQWQMRSHRGMDSLFEQVEFFVDAVSGYNADFALFPELFNAPLMSEYNHLHTSDAIRKLAEHTDDIRQRFQELAISYNVNIITGSMPLMDGNKLLNVGFLCRRDGSYERYEKVHITPNELSAWGMTGGDQIRVFDTDCGRIGIVICYDVEFPELSRLLADQGMNILFVPFLTDTQNGYMRVRSCAAARAIENECYVAIAGCVGNLPKVQNMDIQYAQSAVFTPSDFSFPTNAVKSEATPNTEMTLLADVDLDLLKELHEMGSVRTMKDRRKDLYELRKLNPKK